MPEMEYSYVDGEIDGVVMRPLKFFRDARGLACGIVPAG